MAASAISLNGNAPEVLNNLFESVKPGFESFLGNVPGQAMGNFTPASLGNMLEKFNTTIESLGLVKNVFKGNVPEVLGNLSNLTETFLEKFSAAEQAQELDQTMDETMDQTPEMDMAP